MSHQSNRLQALLIDLTLLVCVCPSAAVVAQTSDEVVINLTVKTKNGSTVERLRAEDFSVTVDKSPQKIVAFETSGIPASVGILIDESGSEQRQYRLGTKLNAAMRRYLQSSEESNVYFLVAFSSQSRLLQDWTSGRELETSINDITLQGQTALYDTLYTSVQKVITGRHARHVLIVFTDGQDSVSKRSFNVLRDTLKNSDVALYAIGLLGFSDAGSSLQMEGQHLLDELTMVTGGKAFFPRANVPSELGEVCEFIAKEIRSQYRLVIKPDPAKDKDWRKIKVKATMRDSSGKLVELRVRSRQEFRQ